MAQMESLVHTPARTKMYPVTLNVNGQNPREGSRPRAASRAPLFLGAFLALLCVPFGVFYLASPKGTMAWNNAMSVINNDSRVPLPLRMSQVRAPHAVTVKPAVTKALLVTPWKAVVVLLAVLVVAAVTIALLSTARLQNVESQVVEPKEEKEEEEAKNEHEEDGENMWTAWQGVLVGALITAMVVGVVVSVTVYAVKKGRLPNPALACATNEDSKLVDSKSFSNDHETLSKEAPKEDAQNVSPGGAAGELDLSALLSRYNDLYDRIHDGIEVPQPLAGFSTYVLRHKDGNSYKVYYPSVFNGKGLSSLHATMMVMNLLGRMTKERFTVPTFLFHGKCANSLNFASVDVSCSFIYLCRGQNLQHLKLAIDDIEMALNNEALDPRTILGLAQKLKIKIDETVPSLREKVIESYNRVYDMIHEDFDESAMRNFSIIMNGMKMIVGTTKRKHGSDEMKKLHHLMMVMHKHGRLSSESELIPKYNVAGQVADLSSKVVLTSEGDAICLLPLNSDYNSAEDFGRLARYYDDMFDLLKGEEYNSIKKLNDAFF